MPFADLDAYSLKALAATEGEEINYRRESGEVDTFFAIVDEISEDELRLPIGRTSRSGKRPVRVWISKLDLTEVDKQRDKIHRIAKDLDYTVAKVLDDRGGGFLLYCQ